VRGGGVRWVGGKGGRLMIPNKHRSSRRPGSIPTRGIAASVVGGIR
jgi:hypothetical protein